MYQPRRSVAADERVPLLFATTAAQRIISAWTIGLRLPAISTAIAWHTWDQLADAEEVANATLFAQVMSGLTVLAAVVMKARDTDERKAFNRRFVAINKFCEKNPDFVWKAGADAPSGFKME